jgi:putative oxidoreductase
MNKHSSAVARILLALTFLGPVILRLISITSAPDGYLQYQMALGNYGLPSVFAPLLILVELAAGLSLLLGFKTKLMARIFAVLALFLAIVLGRVTPEVFFLYLGIAGGMWLLSLYPQTAFALDNRQKNQFN